MQVSLLALGGGTGETLTAQSRTALLQADCIVGAARLLEQLPAGCTTHRAAATKPRQILEALQQGGASHGAVVYSGDTGFYSGCRSLIPLLDQVYKWGWEEMKHRNLPIDALGEMWHGFREPDEQVMRHPYKRTYDK